MRKYLFLLPFLWFFIPTPSLAVYQYYRQITVTSTITVASGTQTNFPMLVSSTLVSWQSTTSNASGRIQNLCRNWLSTEEPCDFTFTTSTPTASGSGWTCPKADFETEKYTSSTGELVGWVKVSSLSASSIVYACYGDNTVNKSQSGSSTVWNSANYNGVWHLPATSTLNVKDSTINAHNGTNNSATTTSTGKIDGAASFNSTSTAYIDVGSGAGVVANTETWSVWANWSALTDNKYLLANFNVAGDTSNGSLKTNLVASNNVLRWFQSYGGGVTNDTFSGSAALSTATWYKVDIVRDNSAKTVQLYLNGATDGAAGTYTGTLDALQQTEQFGGQANFTVWFTGSMDEIRIANATRTADWILDEYNNQSSPQTFYTVGAETAGTVTNAITTFLIQGIMWIIRGASLIIRG